MERQVLQFIVYRHGERTVVGEAELSATGEIHGKIELLILADAVESSAIVTEAGFVLHEKLPKRTPKPIARPDFIIHDYLPRNHRYFDVPSNIFDKPFDYSDQKYFDETERLRRAVKSSELRNAVEGHVTDPDRDSSEDVPQAEWDG